MRRDVYKSQLFVRLPLLDDAPQLDASTRSLSDTRPLPLPPRTSAMSADTETLRAELARYLPDTQDDEKVMSECPSPFLCALQQPAHPTRRRHQHLPELRPQPRQPLVSMGGDSVQQRERARQRREEADDAGGRGRAEEGRAGGRGEDGEEGAQARGAAAGPPCLGLKADGVREGFERT